MFGFNGIIRRTPIRDKLIIFMAFMIIAISFFNLYFYNKAYSSMDEYNNLLKEYSEVNNLSIQLIQGRESISKYVSVDSGSTGDMSQIEKYKDYDLQVNKLIKDISNTANSLDTYLLAKAIKNSLETYEDEISKVSAMRPGDEGTYVQFLNAKNSSSYIESYIKQLLDIKLSEGEWYHQQLTNRVKTIRVINFISVFVIMIISLVFVVALSNGITVPIKKLTQFARNISHGDFGSRGLELNSSDDLNLLAGTLNQMSNNIQNMIRMERQFHEEEIKSIKISKELNEAKFLALQSQINPHFLFNTLNAIARFAMFEGAEKTTKLIESLSSIFRYNLKSTEEVSLNEELNTIKEYASIQKARFGEKLKFDIVCLSDISNVRVPRLIIQPLVENAVIHGLEPKESGGMIRIKVFKRDGQLTIKIIDNGKGISKDHLRRLLDGSAESTLVKGHTTGIGINNVRDRLLLYYRNSDCFKLKSKESFGTVITLNIPEN